MTSRLLATFGLVALMVGLASAQDKKEPSELKDKLKEALESAEEDFPKAITLVEKALAKAPADDPNRRTAIYLIGAMAVTHGDKSDAKADRIAMYHKATEAFDRLRKNYKELTRYEKDFMGKSRIGEARALALEGKTAQSLGVLQKAMAAGFEDYDGLEEIADLEPVVKLPEYKAAVAQAIQASIREEIANFRSFPFDFALKDTDEKPAKLADFKGKLTIVDIWGTWCGPCMMEIPHFVELYKEYHDKGLEMVGINCNEQGTTDEIKKAIRKVIDSKKIPYRCVINDGSTEEKVPGFQGYPTTLFIDGTGRVKFSLVGSAPKAKLEAIIKTFLADASKPDSTTSK